MCNSGMTLLIVKKHRGGKKKHTALMIDEGMEEALYQEFVHIIWKTNRFVDCGGQVKVEHIPENI